METSDRLAGMIETIPYSLQEELLELDTCRYTINNIHDILHAPIICYSEGMADSQKKKRKGLLNFISSDLSLSLDSSLLSALPKHLTRNSNRQICYYFDLLMSSNFLSLYN